jgi:hypothetical protein
MRPEGLTLGVLGTTTTPDRPSSTNAYCANADGPPSPACSSGCSWCETDVAAVGHKDELGNSLGGSELPAKANDTSISTL